MLGWSNSGPPGSRRSTLLPVAFAGHRRLDLVLPYGVVPKIVTVLGLIGTPPAAYYLALHEAGTHDLGRGRRSRVVFVFMESFDLRGDIASTLAGGSPSWSSPLALYLGNLIQGCANRRYLV